MLLVVFFLYTHLSELDTTAITTSNIGSQSVKYATSAGTASNSTKWGGYSLSLKTNNTTDTWVPVLSNDNTFQHRVLPTNLVTYWTHSGLNYTKILKAGYETSLNRYIVDFLWDDGACFRICYEISTKLFSISNCSASGVWTLLGKIYLS